MRFRLFKKSSEFSALICGWLVVALLAPTLLGFTPQKIHSPAESLYLQIEASLCSHDGQAPQPDHQHGGHDQECPCCLPGGLAHHALPLPEPLHLERYVVLPRLTDIFLPEWVEPARHIHAFNQPLQRGPPSFSSVQA